ncbi:hypothetical protein ACJ41O_009085 [Fusarium nematophilum]
MRRYSVRYFAKNDLAFCHMRLSGPLDGFKKSDIPHHLISILLGPSSVLLPHRRIPIIRRHIDQKLDRLLLIKSAMELEQRSEGPHRVEVPSPRPRRPAPRGTASYQRKRAIKACQVCRARRTKCDNLKPPCSFCLKVGATCIQSPVDLSSFDPPSLKILERLDDLEELMRADSLDPDNGSSKAKAVGCEIPIAQSRPVVLSMVQPLTLDNAMTWTCFEGLFTASDQAGDSSAISLSESQPSPNTILRAPTSSPPKLGN